MGANRLSKDSALCICAALDTEVTEFGSRKLPAMRFPYLWVDASHVPCCRNSHDAAAVAIAVTVGEDGVRCVVGFAYIDAESYVSLKGFLRGLRE